MSSSFRFGIEKLKRDLKRDLKHDRIILISKHIERAQAVMKILLVSSTGGHFQAIKKLLSLIHI